MHLGGADVDLCCSNNESNLSKRKLTTFPVVGTVIKHFGRQGLILSVFGFGYI